LCELLFDLEGDVADLVPLEGWLIIGTAHPFQQGEDAGGTGLGICDQGHEGGAECGGIACGLVGVAGAMDGGIFQADEALVVEVDVAEFDDGAGDAGLLDVELGFGQAADEVGELDGTEGRVCGEAVREVYAGKGFVGEEAGVFFGDSLIDGGDEWVVHGGLGFYVGKEFGALIGIGIGQLIDEHHA
jgi:hypothetical protein